MLQKVLIIILFVTLVQGDQWAFLTAGSSGYDNYRHQSDVCHAYQSLIKRGIAKDHIIVMAYDDIAYNDENPFQGALYNKPCSENGEDCWNVYDGCEIDYKGKDVNKETFFKILHGEENTAGNGRVLQTNENDTLFVFFSDHGGPGLVCFPTQYLYKDELWQELQKLHDNKKYSKLVFYLETCESGSMWENLPKDLNIYAVSAADPIESSYGCYCSPGDDCQFYIQNNNQQLVVHGKPIGTCLGDLFTVNWLENLDSIDPSKETLSEQFALVQNETDAVTDYLSQVCQWGNMDFLNDEIGEFEGWYYTQKHSVANSNSITTKTAKHSDLLSQRFSELKYLEHKWQRSGQDPIKMQAFSEKMDYNQRIHNIFSELAQEADVSESIQQSEYPRIQDFQCYRNLMQIFEDQCTKLNDFSMFYLRVFVHICEKKNLEYKEEFVQNILSSICQKWVK